MAKKPKRAKHPDEEEEEEEDERRRRRPMRAALRPISPQSRNGAGGLILPNVTAPRPAAAQARAHSSFI